MLNSGWIRVGWECDFLFQLVEKKKLYSFIGLPFQFNNNRNFLETGREEYLATLIKI